MKHIRIVSVFIVVIFILATWLREKIPAIEFVSPLTTTVFFTVVIYGLYEHLLWKLVPKWFGTTHIPNLGGTWEGLLATEWTDPQTGKIPAPKKCFLVIRQTARTIKVTLITDKSVSSTKLAQIVRDDVQTTVRYLYYNEPQVSVAQRSRAHHGAAVLLSDSDLRQLSGHYWTDRKTQGSLTFSTRHRRRAATYEEASSLSDSI